VNDNQNNSLIRDSSLERKREFKKKKRRLGKTPSPASFSINSKVPQKFFPVSNNLTLDYGVSNDRSFENNFLNNRINSSFQSADNNGNHVYNLLAKKPRNSWEDPNYLNNPFAVPLISTETAGNAIMQLDTYELIKLLLKQYEFFLQLLMQNVLMTNDLQLKYRCYQMLFSLFMARERVIKSFKLPEYDLFFNFCTVRL
jgi:hypothetical protein